MFGKLLDFFKSLGHYLGKAMHIVHELIPEDKLAYGVELVKEAEIKFLDNAVRRDFVIAALRAVGLPESIARLIVELALKIVKKEAGKVIDAAAGAGV